MITKLKHYIAPKEFEIKIIRRDKEYYASIEKYGFVYIPKNELWRFD